MVMIDKSKKAGNKETGSLCKDNLKGFTIKSVKIGLAEISCFH